jgi:hypothetical protein
MFHYPCLFRLLDHRHWSFGSQYHFQAVGISDVMELVQVYGLDTEVLQA